MKDEKYGVGSKHTTNEGYEVEIVEKLKYPMRKVRFENGYEVIVFIEAITRRSIKNPCHPSVLGIGYYGVGEYRANIDGKSTLEYVVWTGMLKRCYDDKFQEKHPTYKGTIICKEWFDFQTFAKWYHNNLPKIDNIQFQLDKDLLQENAEDKMYSPSVCIFLPQSVNGFLTNKQSGNTSGYIGVSWDKRDKKWTSKIKLFGEDKRKYLGYFDTPEEASIVYQKARLEQAEKVKDYLRSLNYLPEHIIQLIK